MVIVWIELDVLRMVLQFVQNEVKRSKVKVTTVQTYALTFDGLLSSSV